MLMLNINLMIHLFLSTHYHVMSWCLDTLFFITYVMWIHKYIPTSLIPCVFIPGNKYKYIERRTCFLNSMLACWKGLKAIDNCSLYEFHDHVINLFIFMFKCGKRNYKEICCWNLRRNLLIFIIFYFNAYCKIKLEHFISPELAWSSK